MNTNKDINNARKKIKNLKPISERSSNVRNETKNT